MLHPGGFKDRAGRAVMFCSMGQDCLKSTCFVSHSQKKKGAAWAVVELMYRRNSLLKKLYLYEYTRIHCMGHFFCVQPRFVSFFLKAVCVILFSYSSTVCGSVHTMVCVLYCCVDPSLLQDHNPTVTYWAFPRTSLFLLCAALDGSVTQT